MTNKTPGKAEGLGERQKNKVKGKKTKVKHLGKDNYVILDNYHGA